MLDLESRRHHHQARSPRQPNRLALPEDLHCPYVTPPCTPPPSSPSPLYRTLYPPRARAGHSLSLHRRPASLAVTRLLLGRLPHGRRQLVHNPAMVRILPGRLKSTASAANSRSSSPLRNKMEGLSPVKDTGLALKVAILRVRLPMRARAFVCFAS